MLNLTGNNFLPHDFHWEVSNLFLVVFLSFITLGTTLGNFLVLYAFLSRPSRLNYPTHYFIANLALADLLVGVCVMPYLSSFQVFGKWYYGSVYCDIWTVTHFTLCSVSIFSTCAVSIERYISVSYPFTHTSILTPSRIRWTIISIWMSSGILTIFALYMWPQPKSNVAHVCEVNLQLGHAIVAVSRMYIPAILTAAFYLKFYSVIKQHLKWMTTFSSTTASTENSTCGSPTSLNSMDDAVDKSVGNANFYSIEEKQLRLARRLGFLVAMLLTTYIPYFTCYILTIWNPSVFGPKTFNLFRWIRYMNSFINPAIYAYAVPAYREVLREMFICG